MALWQSDEAVAATGGQTPCDWVATGVSIDTRSLQPGDLFVALTAARDGHDFVAQALEKGAAAALVSRVPDGVSAQAPLLIVEDVQTGLEALGRAARARTDARVAAITGSAGKTSTKEMLVAMLQDQGRTHASVLSYNNHWGVPLTLARMPRDTDYAVIEIGMNHPGEIAPLARMARPHVAMVTTVAPAHLEAFENIEGIAREKASIMEGLEPGGVAVLNADVPTAQILREAVPAGMRAIGFGTDADLKLGPIEQGADGLTAPIQLQGTPATLSLQANGVHFAMNGLGALGVAEALGADRAASLHGLAGWSPVGGRGAREAVRLTADPANPVLLIDDSYNANPASVAASLAVLAGGAATGRRVAILGDMKELGPTGPQLHAEVAQLPAMAKIDVVHTVGPLMQALHDALPEDKRGLWRDSADALAEGGPALLLPGDTVLVKGSLSMKLAQVVAAIRACGLSDET